MSNNSKNEIGSSGKFSEFVHAWMLKYFSMLLKNKQF